jgi:hypothetical protein
MENATSDHQIVPSSIDMNVAGRYEVLYAPAESGGVARKIRHSLVPIRFRVVVWGTSQADAMTNLRTLNRILTHSEGGYIRYKPLGLAAGVMTTYYRYLPSRPARVVNPGAYHNMMMETYMQTGRADTEYGIVVECEVMTKPWATSDPSSLTTIQSQTTIENTDDGTYDNYVEIAESAVKGDAIFPVIRIQNKEATSAYRYFVHHFKEADGLSTNKDMHEISISGGWLQRLGSWADQSDSTAASGTRVETSSATGAIYGVLEDFDLDHAYMGKVTPWVRAKTEAATEYDIRVQLLWGSSILEQTAYQTVDQTTWETFFFEEVDIPPTGVPGRITDASSPDISQFLGNIRFEIYAIRTTGSGDLHLDILGLSNAKNFVAIFEGSYLSAAGTEYLEIERPTETFGEYTSAGRLSAAQSSWGKYGTPISRLMFEKGYDHRLRFHSAKSSLDDDKDHETYITVLGLYATMTPFEES